MASNGTASTLIPSFVASSPSSPEQSAPPSAASASSPPLPSVTPPADSSAAPAPSSPAAAQSNPPSSAEPSSSQPAAPSSPAPVSTPPPQSSSPPPQSSAPPPASSAPPAQSSSPPPANSTPSPVATSVVTASSATPSATEVRTSIIVVTPTPSAPGETPAVVTITSVITPSNQQSQASNTGKPSSSPSSSDAAGLQGAQKDGSGSGLSTGGKTAIAVVIPVVAVALLVLGAILFWRRRKQRKNNEDERRKEVEEYGYNPNHDPTLPAVVGGAEMAEDSSGYRGWGNTATSSGRKASTTLTSGMTYSDSNSNPGGYISPHSPTNAYSDANSNDPLVNGRRETLDADGIAALGAAPTANNQGGVHRGPSNASSSYSAANHSDNSGEYPGMPNNNPQEYYDQAYGSYQDGPYGGNAAYGAGGGHQPVIRDVSARRNTRIENPSVYPQGNSGVATNF